MELIQVFVLELCIKDNYITYIYIKITTHCHTKLKIAVIVNVFEAI